MRVDASKVVLWLTGIFVLIHSLVVPAKTNRRATRRSRCAS